MWEEYVQELIEYQQRFGHCSVSKNDDKYKELYNWIHNVRSSYARSQRGEEPSIELDDDLVSNLQSLGLRLSLVPSRSRWKRRLKELLEFRNINGHFKVPLNSKDYHRLAGWLLKLRKDYIRREQGEDISILADMQLAKLEKIGYNFEEDYFIHAHPNRQDHDKLWHLRLQELKDFKKKHGHFNVPPNTEVYKSLWHWMRNNQHAYSKIENEGYSSRLTKERLSELKEIGFKFPSKSSTWSLGTSSDNLSDRWDQRIQELRDFKETHGHFDVPVDVEKYKQLANWMRNNRQHYNNIRKGEKSSRLTSERLIQLMDMGFKFRPCSGTNDGPSNPEERWNLRMKELEAFKKTHGHFRIPTNCEKYKPLSNWVTNNLVAYNKVQKGTKSSRLTEQRMAQLESIGFRFDDTGRSSSNGMRNAPSVEERWNLRVKELEAFKKAHGHFRIPTHCEKYKPLSNWVSYNKIEYNKVQKGTKSSRLTEQRMAQLESIGFRFDDIGRTTSNGMKNARSDPEERWNLRVKELEAFYKAHGHFRIPTNCEKYKPLSWWIKNNQTEYNKVQKGTKSCRLTEQRMAQLDSIGFRFDDIGRSTSNGMKNAPSDPEERWNLRVKELEAFYEAHGHFRIPTHCEKYKPLFKWISNNQVEYNNIQKGWKSSRMTDERMAQLESIGFRFYDTRKSTSNAHSDPEERWILRVKELEAFYKAHGHFRIPSNCEKYQSLKSWVKNNQAEYNRMQTGWKSSRLTAHRIAQLESIGFHFVDTRKHVQYRLENESLRESPPDNNGSSAMKSNQESHQDVETTKTKDPNQVAMPFFLEGLDDFVVGMMAEMNRIQQEKDNATRTGAAMKSYQQPHQDGETAYTKDPSNSAIPSFLQGLDGAITAMMAEMDRVEQEKENFASNPNCRMGKPNFFWLDVGNSDGIHF